MSTISTIVEIVDIEDFFYHDKASKDIKPNPGEDIKPKSRGKAGFWPQIEGEHTLTFNGWGMSGSHS